MDDFLCSVRLVRHGFGVNAFESNVPPHLVQRWLGHASLRTTAIYADVIGPDERAFAARHPAVLDKLRTLTAAGRIDVASFHYGDQLFLAGPPEDWE